MESFLRNQRMENLCKQSFCQSGRIQGSVNQLYTRILSSLKLKETFIFQIPIQFLHFGSRKRNRCAAIFSIMYQLHFFTSHSPINLSSKLLVILDQLMVNQAQFPCFVLPSFSAHYCEINENWTCTMAEKQSLMVIILLATGSGVCHCTINTQEMHMSEL